MVDSVCGGYEFHPGLQAVGETHGIEEFTVPHGARIKMGQVVIVDVLNPISDVHGGEAAAE